MHQRSFPNFWQNVRLLAMLSVLAWAACPGLIQAQTIADGSFELDLASTTVSNSGAGWTGSSGDYIYSNSSGHGSTPYGAQWLFISTGSESQTISGFTIGKTYAVSLQAADLEGGTIPALTLSVSGGAAASQTFVLTHDFAYFNNTPLAFVNCQLTFTPTTTAPITLSFYEPNHYPVAIDQVTLVPEPGTWAMLLLGLALIGVPIYRRHAAGVPAAAVHHSC